MDDRPAERRILESLGEPDLVERLAALRGTDFTSFLLAVFRKRASKVGPPDVLHRYRDGRFATATDAARAFGWKVSTYLGHENGDRNPSRDAAKRYAKAYKLQFFTAQENDLLDRVAEMILPADEHSPFLPLPA